MTAGTELITDAASMLHRATIPFPRAPVKGMSATDTTTRTKYAVIISMGRKLIQEIEIERAKLDIYVLDVPILPK
jgi:hypothetical protein